MKRHWTLKDRREMFKDVVLKIEHRDYHFSKNGQTGTFTVVSMKDWAVIIPVTKEGKFILVKQFRIATGEVTYEFPGGALEAGEDADTGALRELTEETGFAGSLTLLSKMRPNPAFMDNFCYAYVASDCEKVKELNLDPFEDIEPVEVTRQELDAMIADGRIAHSIPLSAYGVFRAKGY
ncbi:MAG: NUDIX hydrolase [Deferribacterales bacterium]